MSNKKGKGERPVPDVKDFTNEKLVEEFAGSGNWYDWTTSAEQDRYYEAYHGALKTELLRRLSPTHDNGPVSIVTRKETP